MTLTYPCPQARLWSRSEAIAEFRDHVRAMRLATMAFFRQLDAAGIHKACGIARALELHASRFEWLELATQAGDWQRAAVQVESDRGAEANLVNATAELAEAVEQVAARVRAD